MSQFYYKIFLGLILLSSLGYTVSFVHSNIDFNELNRLVKSISFSNLTGNYMIDAYIVTAALGIVQKFNPSNINSLIIKYLEQLWEFIFNKTDADADINSVIFTDKIYINESSGSKTTHNFIFRSIIWYMTSNTNFNVEDIKSYELEIDTEIETIRYLANSKEKFKLTNDINCFIQKKEDEKKDKTDKKENISSKSFTIVLSTKKSQLHLRNFVSKCCEEYTEYNNSKNNKNRYIVVYNKNKTHSSEKFILYNIHSFDTNKNFDNIFFDDKTKIVNYIKFFQNNKQFYEKNGFPHTLGILLSGPPGTGKQV
jgi:hypothetical protein